MARQSESNMITMPHLPKRLTSCLNQNILPPPNLIWECACGGGHLAEALKTHGVESYCTDLIDRGYGTGGIDFLKSDLIYNVDTILTNPPYKYATDFVLHALDILPDQGRVIMFLKTTFLEGQDRWKRLHSKTPPIAMYQFIERQRCARHGEFSKQGNNAIAYAWFEWQKGCYRPPKIFWI